MTRDLASDPAKESQSEFNAAPDASRPQSFQIKGVLLPLTLLDIKHNDLQLVQKELAAKVKASPEFFNKNPLVFGLERAEVCASLTVKSLAEMSSSFGFIPTGIKGGTHAQQQQAEHLNLAVFPAGRTPNRKAAHDLADDRDQRSPDLSQKLSAVNDVINQIVGHTAGLINAVDSCKQGDSQRSEHEDSDATSSEAIINPATRNEPTAAGETAKSDNQVSSAALNSVAEAPLIIDTPVRSGQQIFHKGDLIVLASVSHGAELLSEGNIHVYGALRGRALAGVRGDESARVFCSSQEAELISIAGHFVIDEHLKESHWKQPVHVFYNGDGLTIKALVEQ